MLTFRGELISDVTAFIVHTPPPDDDRAVIARMPEQPTDALSLMAAFQNFGVPSPGLTQPPRRQRRSSAVAGAQAHR